MRDTTEDLAGLWRWFVEQFREHSALYERVADVVADDREVLELLLQAPPEAHLPLAPLAAVRYLLLDGLDHPLGEVYAGRSAADPGPLFVDLCRNHRTEVLGLLATRRVQTNDCGRSALIGPALTWVAERLPAPYALVDVGTSAGLTLLGDRYRLDYGGHRATGPADSSVRITCEVTGGDPPIADRLPALAHRVGIDLSPIDLSDPADARWLLACVWPDSDRAQRLEAAIHLAANDPPPVVAGRANERLPEVLADLPAGVSAIVTTTWAFGYFSPEEREEFVDLLRIQSERRPIAWVVADEVATVGPLLPGREGDTPGSAMGALLFDDGPRPPLLLARVHPHGDWIDWRAPP